MPESRIERIKKYEAMLDEAAALLKTEPRGERLALLTAELDAYYTGKSWKEDFAADEAGLLPPGLKRGVLSEDGIYNLLTDYREALEESAHSAAVYIHGSGGSASEAEHYKPLFPGCDVTGFDYKAKTPAAAKEEFNAFFEDIKSRYGSVTLIANSIGAYFAVYAGLDAFVQKAYFISPVVNMEGLIRNMMLEAGVSEEELREKQVIKTPSGAELSWDYLRFAAECPEKWDAPAVIIYGENDSVVPRRDVGDFAARNGAKLCVMENGEHWFHTDGQLRFIDECIKNF